MLKRVVIVGTALLLAAASTVAVAASAAPGAGVSPASESVGGQELYGKWNMTPGAYLVLLGVLTGYVLTLIEIFDQDHHDNQEPTSP